LQILPPPNRTSLRSVSDRFSSSNVYPRKSQDISVRAESRSFTAPVLYTVRSLPFVMTENCSEVIDNRGSYPSLLAYRDLFRQSGEYHIPPLFVCYPPAELNGWAEERGIFNENGICSKTRSGRVLIVDSSFQCLTQRKQLGSIPKKKLLVLQNKN
jgi:hypothetical protein